MSELTKIRDYYFKLKQHGTLAYIRDVKNYALDNFEFVLSIAYEHETRQPDPKSHTIADNYGAGDLSRLEPCVFCEDFEKIESERDAMYEALDLIRTEFLSATTIDPYWLSDIAFDMLTDALAKAKGE